MLFQKNLKKWVAGAVVVTGALVACSSDDNFVIGGTVTGLNGTLVLQNNGVDDLTITENGTFEFATRATNYIVTVESQPNNQTCTVANGVGTAEADVTDITVTCEVGSAAFRIMYLTSATFTGDLDTNDDGNGIEEADEACNSDASKPNSGTYKALIADATNRNACDFPDCSPSGGATDWVLAANTEYRREDGTTVIGTTNSEAIFEFPLDNPVGDSSFFWTGITLNWLGSTLVNLDCTDWTSIAGMGFIADSSSETSDAIQFTSDSCANPNKLVCVEQ